MDFQPSCQKAARYLHMLCEEIPTRRVGSQGNQAATRFFGSVMQDLGYRIETQRFDCQDYQSGEVHLSIDGQEFSVQISPYSPGCDLTAELVVASDLDKLKNGDFKGKILLLKGNLTKEQLMPKNFIFYNPESHQEIFRLLETKQPAAILTATGRNPELAGAPYPFPMIEDGDFDIPSAYLTDVEGERLAGYTGENARLLMQARRIPSWAENVIVRKQGRGKDWLLVCAHIDAKDGTPGAVDNACGAVTLMLLAELLRDCDCGLNVEIFAVNGEDHYSVGGEMEFLRRNQGLLSRFKLAINVDGIGYKGHSTSVSFYDCAAAWEEKALQVMDNYPSITRGEQWYQSDHMVFVMNQVPALAVTTSAFMQMEQEIAHTEKDRLDQVDTHLLAEAAFYLKDLICSF